MATRFRTQVTSGEMDFNRANVEIEAYNPNSASYELCAIMNCELARPEIILYPRLDSKPWQFELDDFLSVLQSAREELRFDADET